MTNLVLQISPEAGGAYFADYLCVARREFEQVFGDTALDHRKTGPLEFFEIPVLDVDSEIDREAILRLSFVQGLFEREGERLLPLDIEPRYRLHRDFVFGSKYRGKTNEHLTQMLINVGLAALGADRGEGLKLLDPMCGRATTLLWAMRYGMQAKGVEQDSAALADIRRNLKKWTKLHRQKHRLTEGFVGRATKQGEGKFLEFHAEGSSMKVVTGDARQLEQALGEEKFHLIVSDLPYGVQHLTREKSRNPLDMLGECSDAWRAALKKGGAVVLAFNRYNPGRKALIEAFEQCGFVAQAFSAEHRMSESIVRDVVVFKLSE